MKVLLINPWGVNNDKFYTSGFIHGMNCFVSLSFASNYYYEGEIPNDKIYRIFFEKTENMQRSKKRKLLRGLEYLDGWIKILRIAESGNFDVIHIHWLLMYKVDVVFVPILKKYCNKLILTAHNVIPHINGDKSIKDLRKLYSYFDAILLHGRSLIQEFTYYFPNLFDRLHLQYHGEYFGQSTSCCEDSDQRVLKIFRKRKEFKKTFIIFGNHFYNKGTDRVLTIWLNDMKFKNSQLIIAGKINKNYSQLLSLIPEAKKRENILILDFFVENDLLNYFIRKSNVVVIPYRHASMSGVLHTAAVFEKTVICTKTGAMAEYLENKVDSFICENTDDSLYYGISIANDMENDRLNEMGIQLHKNISEKYSWKVITRSLYEDVYCK